MSSEQHEQEKEQEIKNNQDIISPEKEKKESEEEKKEIQPENTIKENDNNDNSNENNSYISEGRKYEIKYIIEDSAKDELVFKVLIVGDQAVGKTSLSLRATKNLYQSAYKTTIGFDIFNYIVEVNGVIIKLQIWDTCGLEEFSACTPSLYKNASLVLVAYSINNRTSFENVTRWVNLLKKSSRPETLIFLVANKADLVDDREVSVEEGMKAKEEQDFGFFIETSAKDGLNIQNLFLEGAVQLYEQFVNNKDGDEPEREDFTKNRGASVLSKQSHKETKKHGCC